MKNKTNIGVNKRASHRNRYKINARNLKMTSQKNLQQNWRAKRKDKNKRCKYEDIQKIINDETKKKGIAKNEEKTRK